MKYLSLRRVVLIAMIALAAAELSRGLFNPISFDIFTNCFDGTSAPTSFECEYAPQLMIHTMGGLIFFAGAFILGFRTTRLMNAMSTIGLAVLYIVLQMAVWRFEVSISDNFAALQFQAPETFTQYAYTTLISLDGLLVGLILAELYVLGTLVNRNAIDASKRKEPRQTFSKKKSRK